MSHRPKVNEVFTPRNAEVNPVMYIRRPEHEREIKRSVEGSLHTLVCGESGSGKSWLYKHVAQTEDWSTFYANAGNAARYRSLTQTISAALFPEGSKEHIEYCQVIEGKAELLGIGAGAETERRYSVRTREILLRAFETARHQSGNRAAVLVIDNLEAIFSKPELMEELGNIILLLDDPDYAKYKVKLLIVGVPSDVVDYFQKIPNLEPVANRLHEVSAVRSLSAIQIGDFVRRGFVDQLRVELSPFDLKDIAAHVECVTLGIAQRLHEYCEALAYRLEDSGWRFNSKQFDSSDEKYLIGSLRKSYAVVDSCMNERKTKAGRRNQVLFALSKVTSTTFDAKFVEELVRAEFPISTNNTTLAVGQTLAELSATDRPLLRRNTKGNGYRFADPKYLMCLRIMLRKTDTGERVQKANFKR